MYFPSAIYAQCQVLTGLLFRYRRDFVCAFGGSALIPKLTFAKKASVFTKIVADVCKWDEFMCSTPNTNSYSAACSAKRLSVDVRARGEARDGE